ncbi:uncharacterized protein PV09_01088 [Verruconis gallopava]|uniref:Rhodopsin domain-containing protein n=1 Tax=Verruconis gallopava TaxID=253628 RepID=A0A0D2ANQ2_9PEZI|nr:uncharacterized protein PV09_01088 [Verruconis gallopava]KIW08155.1 hypothetical protein PV09_01088 [Verruconis gallopava]
MVPPTVFGQIVERTAIPADALPVKVGTYEQGISVQVTCGVFMSLSWIAVILRFYTRGVLVRNIGADDIWILLAVIFFTVYNVSCIVCAGATMGDGYLRIGNVDAAFNWLMAAESFYVVTMCALKVSVSIFFLRVMIKPWQRKIVYASLLLATLINIAYFFLIVFQCGVPRGGMSFLIKQLAKKCLTPAQFLGVSYTHGAISSVTDIVFALLPFTVLRESKLRTRERATVVAILALAAIGGVASMVRLNYVSRLATAVETWFADANLVAIWSAIEPGLGICASSLATLRPLFRGIFGTNSSFSNSSFHATQYARFPSLKSGSTRVEELPVRKDESNESFEFIQTGFANARFSLPPPPHQIIPKEPWRPSASTDRSGMTSRIGKAEELLGEDLSNIISPRLGNSVSCEGPSDAIRAHPHRCSSICKLHGRRPTKS